MKFTTLELIYPFGEFKLADFFKFFKKPCILIPPILFAGIEFLFHFDISEYSIPCIELNCIILIKIIRLIFSFIISLILIIILYKGVVMSIKTLTAKYLFRGLQKDSQDYLAEIISSNKNFDESRLLSELKIRRLITPIMALKKVIKDKEENSILLIRSKEEIKTFQSGMLSPDYYFNKLKSNDYRNAFEMVKTVYCVTTYNEPDIWTIKEKSDLEFYIYNYNKNTELRKKKIELTFQGQPSIPSGIHRLFIFDSFPDNIDNNLIENICKSLYNILKTNKLILESIDINNPTVRFIFHNFAILMHNHLSIDVGIVPYSHIKEDEEILSMNRANYNSINNISCIGSALIDNNLILRADIAPDNGFIYYKFSRLQTSDYAGRFMNLLCPNRIENKNGELYHNNCVINNLINNKDLLDISKFFAKKIINKTLKYDIEHA